MAEKDDDIYDKVVKASIEIMSQKGYHGATISQISRQADISRESIYYRQRFKDKAEILTAIFAQGWKTITETATDSAAKTDNYFEKVEQILTDTVEFLLKEENFNMLKVMLAEVRQIDQRLRQAVITEEFAEFMSLLKEITVSAQKNGILSDDFNLDAFLWTVESIAESLLEVTYRDIPKDFDLHLDFDVQDIKEMVLRFIVGCTLSWVQIEQVIHYNKKLVIPPTSEEIDEVAQKLNQKVVSAEVLQKVRQMPESQWTELKSKIG